MKPNKEQILKKWIPIIEMFEFPKKHYVKIAEYCEYHFLIENEDHLSMFPPEYRTETFDKPYEDLFESTLGQSLKVLSKIDLNKVEFTPSPAGVITNPTIKQTLEGPVLDANPETFTVGTYQLSIDVKPSDIVELGVLGIDLLDEVNHKAIEIMVEEINNLIEKNEKVIFYQVISKIAKTKAHDQVVVLSRYYIPKHELTIDDL